MNNSNNTFDYDSKYCKYWGPESDLEMNATFFAIMFLCIVGVISNIFIIVLAAKYTVRKNLHHLVINMAVSDVIFLILSANRTLQNNNYNVMLFVPGGVCGDIICKLDSFLYLVAYQVSTMSLLVISIERFRARHKKNTTKITTIRETIYSKTTCSCTCYLLVNAYDSRVLYTVYIALFAKNLHI